MEIQPYLFFEGRCEEALEFYKTHLGAKITMLMRFKEAPDPSMISPGSENKIMHASFTVGPSTVSASDGKCSGTTKMDGFALTLYVATSADAQRLFTILSQNGEVTMPLAKTFYSPSFGMLKDQFGLHWMVMVPPAK